MFHPLMRVWIEIAICEFAKYTVKVSPSYEGVDWNYWLVYCDLRVYVSPSYEGVDWNIGHGSISFDYVVSPSYEGVDWNLGSTIQYSRTPNVSPSYEGVDWNIALNTVKIIALKFHPLMRVWIEISNALTCNLKELCFTLLWGCGLKSCCCICYGYASRVSPSYEGVDWNLPLVFVFNLVNVSPSYEGVDWN